VNYKLFRENARGWGYPLQSWVSRKNPLPRFLSRLCAFTFFPRSRITGHQSHFLKPLFLRLPPSLPNATIWCSMTPANPQPSPANRPRVGIPWRTSEEEAQNNRPKIQSYEDAIYKAGGQPVLMPLSRPAELQRVLPTLDAFVLPGSPADVAPAPSSSTPWQKRSPSWPSATAASCSTSIWEAP
jgi:hypothetical protein